MAQEEAGLKKPFRVQTTDGVFVKGYDTLEAAQASAVERNDVAKSMEIKARYEGVPKS